MVDIWLMKTDKAGEIAISTTDKDPKPCLLVPIKQNEWIKISLPDALYEVDALLEASRKAREILREGMESLET